MMLMVVSVLMVQMVLQSFMRVLMTVVRIQHLDWAQTTVVQHQLERYVLIDFVLFNAILLSVCKPRLNQYPRSSSLIYTYRSILERTSTTSVPGQTITSVFKTVLYQTRLLNQEMVYATVSVLIVVHIYSTPQKVVVKPNYHTLILPIVKTNHLQYQQALVCTF